MSTLSIGILTANRDDLLRRLLLYLLPQIAPTDEVIVLDTVGRAETAGEVARLGSSQVSYHVYPHQPFRFAEARNALVSIARGDMLAFIDDDAVPYPGWVEQIRENLTRYAASGGPTVAMGNLPSWWNYEINWTIGLSPPGTVLGLPGYYPDTCNMAAQAVLWKSHPFQSIQGGPNLYSAGREDASWWMTRRQNGDQITVDFRQAVAHPVHFDRVSRSYIKARAQQDGLASWLRHPSMKASTDISWDLAHAAGEAFDSLFSANKVDRLPKSIWFQRQLGLFKAVWGSPISLRPRHRSMITEILKALFFQIRIRLGRLTFRAIRAIRAGGHFPPENPSLIFVSADCQLGDTLLLRRHIANLGHSNPGNLIVVSAKYPELLTGLPENIQIFPADSKALTELLESRSPAVAIVPYYSFGDYRRWRRQLSPVGISFDCDVGFPGRRDYLYSRKIITKNLDLHEHENLAQLFAVLSPPDATRPVSPPALSPEAREWLQDFLQTNGIQSPYIVVQFGAGYEAKEWPLKRWIPFLHTIASSIKHPIVIIGNSNWAEAAQVAISEVRTDVPIFSLAGNSSVSQLMALVSRAAMLIGGCSGPKHLAMAFGTPTFTLYAATEPHRWGATEDWHLHAYVNALPQKLNSMELQHLPEHHRILLLEAESTAQAAIHHWNALYSTEAAKEKSGSN